MTNIIDAHIAHIKAAGFSPRTIHDRTGVLRRADRDLPDGLTEATVEDLAAWLGRDGWSQWTRHTYYGHLVGFFKWGVSGDDPWLRRNTAASLIPPSSPDQAPHPVAEDDLAVALARSDDRWRGIITLAAYAGLRVSEIGALRREDVTVKRIHIINGKGGKGAFVPTDAKVWAWVKPRPAGLLFASKVTGREYARGSLSTQARTHFNSIGLPRVHLHGFRHRFCTHLVELDVNLAVVQKVARHKSMQTTMGYVLVSDRAMEDAISRLSEIGDAA